MEAQSELEAKEHLVHFKFALDFILDEILIKTTLKRDSTVSAIEYSFPGAYKSPQPL